MRIAQCTPFPSTPRHIFPHNPRPVGILVPYPRRLPNTIARPFAPSKQMIPLIYGRGIPCVLKKESHAGRRPGSYRRLLNPETEIGNPFAPPSFSRVYIQPSHRPSFVNSRHHSTVRCGSSIKQTKRRRLRRLASDHITNIVTNTPPPPKNKKKNSTKMGNPVGIYIAIALAISLSCATVALLTYLHYRRRLRRDQHHNAIITYGPPAAPFSPPPYYGPPAAAPPPFPLSGPMPPQPRPTVPAPPPGPRGPGAHGPGSQGRPDRPPLQGYYAPATPGGVPPSREEVERAAAPPVGGYYAPVYAPVPVPGAGVGAGPGAGAGAGAGPGPGVGVGGKYV